MNRIKQIKSHANTMIIKNIVMSFKQLWIRDTLAFLKIGGVYSKNNEYGLIDKYILEHFDLSKNMLEMTNSQIAKGVSHEISKSISTRTVSRAIAKLRHLTILINHRGFLIRHKHGKLGNETYLQINPVMLPHGKMDNPVEIKSRVESKDLYRKQKFKLELKYINRVCNSLTKRLNKLKTLRKRLIEYYKKNNDI